MCLDMAERAEHPIDLHYHPIAPAGQGTRSIPRHNHLRGCGAPPTLTRGNAVDGVTPGFGAEPLQGSRKGDHWTISYKPSCGVLRIETMGDSRERHVRNLPCATVYDVVSNTDLDDQTTSTLSASSRPSPPQSTSRKGVPTW